MTGLELTAMMALLFYWVPFALAAYIVDIWLPEHRNNVRTPARHMRHDHAHAH